VSLHDLLVRLISFDFLPIGVSPTPALSFSQTLDQLLPFSHWALQEYSLPSNLAPIIAVLSTGQAHAISDAGSSKDKFGTSAFTNLNAQDSSIIGLNIFQDIRTIKATTTANLLVFLTSCW
jgi:hypothetical protein